MNVASFQSKTGFPQKRPTVTGPGTFVQSTFIRPCLNFEPVTHKRVANTFELHHTRILLDETE